MCSRASVGLTPLCFLWQRDQAELLDLAQRMEVLAGLSSRTAKATSELEVEVGKLHGTMAQVLVQQLYFSWYRPCRFDGCISHVIC